MGRSATLLSNNGRELNKRNVGNEDYFRDKI